MHACTYMSFGKPAAVGLPDQSFSQLPEPQNPSINVSELHRIHRMALKLRERFGWVAACSSSFLAGLTSRHLQSAWLPDRQQFGSHKFLFLLLYPTNFFTTLELQNPSHDVSELHKIRQSPDLEALKLWKGSSGSKALFFIYCSLWRIGFLISDWWLKYLLLQSNITGAEAVTR